MDESTLAGWLDAFQLGSGQNKVLMLLGGLRQLTDWDEDTLCRHLGCPGMQPEGEASERTVHSEAYLKWVTRLCGEGEQSQDHVQARREVVVRAFELCDGAGGRVSTRVERCDAAMEAPSANELSGMTLLRLGEISAAFAQGARKLESGPAHDRQLLFDSQTPSFRSGHLHPRRLEILLTGSDAAVQRFLGGTVSYRMREHLNGCTSCKATVLERPGLREMIQPGLTNVA